MGHWLHHTWLTRHLSLWWLLFTHSHGISSGSHNLVIDSLFESCDLSLPPAGEAAEQNDKADSSDQNTKQSHSLSLRHWYVAHGSVGLANCLIACYNFVDKSLVVIAHLWSVINKPSLSKHCLGITSKSEMWILSLDIIKIQVEEGILDFFCPNVGFVWSKAHRDATILSRITINLPALFDLTLESFICIHNIGSHFEDRDVL